MILVRATSVEQAERDLVNVLEEHLRGLMDPGASRIHPDEFPTVWVILPWIGRIVSEREQFQPGWRGSSPTALTRDPKELCSALGARGYHPLVPRPPAECES